MVNLQEKAATDLDICALNSHCEPFLRVVRFQQL
jgi:hypothetical protein